LTVELFSAVPCSVAEELGFGVAGLLWPKTGGVGARLSCVYWNPFEQLLVPVTLVALANMVVVVFAPTVTAVLVHVPVVPEAVPTTVPVQSTVVYRLIVVDPVEDVPLNVGVVLVLLGLAGVLPVITGVPGVNGFVVNCWTLPNVVPPEFVATAQKKYVVNGLSELIAWL
jgi:hypothetical protein